MPKKWSDFGPPNALTQQSFLIDSTYDVSNLQRNLRDVRITDQTDYFLLGDSAYPFELLHYTPDLACKIVNTCVVFHNLCIHRGLEEPELAGADFNYENLGNFNQQQEASIMEIERETWTELFLVTRVKTELHMGYTKRFEKVSCNARFSDTSLLKFEDGEYMLASSKGNRTSSGANRAWSWKVVN
ncbi:hypothetical protein Trydic_g772 [Trypoxylus dichotomus]